VQQNPACANNTRRCIRCKSLIKDKRLLGNLVRFPYDIANGRFSRTRAKALSKTDDPRFSMTPRKVFVISPADLGLIAR
jgi:hypothetical protein